MELKYKLLLSALVVCTWVGCSSTVNIPPVTDSFPNFDITGQWAILGDDTWKNEIMFDFRQPETMYYELKVWGHRAEVENILIGQNQFIFTYKTDANQTFSVLGTILADDQVKLSRVKASLNGFEPLGKLGEKVYYLQKITEGEPHMLTKAPGRSGGNLLRRY